MKNRNDCGKIDRRNPLFKRLAVLLVLLLCVEGVWGYDFRWKNSTTNSQTTTSGNDNWSNGRNWDYYSGRWKTDTGENDYPGKDVNQWGRGDDSVYFFGEVEANCIVDVSPGKTLTSLYINRTRDSATGTTGPTTIEINSGITLTTGTLQIAGGTFNLTGAGTLIVNGNVTIAAGATLVIGEGVALQVGGSITGSGDITNSGTISCNSISCNAFENHSQISSDNLALTAVAFFNDGTVNLTGSSVITIHRHFQDTSSGSKYAKVLSGNFSQGNLITVFAGNAEIAEFNASDIGAASGKRLCIQNGKFGSITYEGVSSGIFEISEAPEIRNISISGVAGNPLKVTGDGTITSTKTVSAAGDYLKFENPATPKVNGSGYFFLTNSEDYAGRTTDFPEGWKVPGSVFIWKGTVSGDLATPGNWEGGSIPVRQDGTEDVIIDTAIGGSNPNVTAGFNLNLKSLSVSASSTLDLNNGTLTVTGFLENLGTIINADNISISGNSNLGGTVSTVKLTVVNKTATEIDVDIIGTSHSISAMSMAGNIKVNLRNDVTVTNGIVIEEAGNSLTNSFEVKFTGNGSLTSSQIEVFRAASASDVIGTLTLDVPAVLSGDLVTHSGTTAQIKKNLTTKNVIHSANSTSPETQLIVAGTLTVNDSLNLNAGGNSGNQLTVNNGGAVTAKTLTTGTSYSNGSFTNAIINNGTITVTDALTNTSAVSGSGTFTVSGNFTDTGTWTGTGMITLSGASVQTISLVAATTYPEFTLSGAGSKNFAGTWNASGITQNADITFTGDTTFSPTSFTSNSGVINFAPGSGNKMTFNAGSDQNNPFMAELVFVNGTTKVASDFYFGKDVTIRNGAILNDNGNNLYLHRSSNTDLTFTDENTTKSGLVCDGTFTAASNAIIITNGITEFNNLDVSNSKSIRTSSSFIVKGSLDTRGNFSATAGTVTFTGNSNTVSGNNTFNDVNVTGKSISFTGENNFNKLSLSGTGVYGSTVSFGAGQTQTVNGTFTVTGGSGTGEGIVLTTTSASPDISDENTWWKIDVPAGNVHLSHTDVIYSSSENPLNLVIGDGITESVSGSTKNWFVRKYYWIGGQNTDWDDGRNWSTKEDGSALLAQTQYPEYVQGITEIEIIGNSGGTTNVLTLSGTEYKVAKLTVKESMEINLNGKKLTAGYFVNAGTVTLDGGELEVSTSYSNTGTVVSAGSETVTLPASSSDSGTWEYTGGTIKNYLTYNDVEISGDAALAEAVTANGTVTIESGKTLTLGNYNLDNSSGSTSNSGTILVNGTGRISQNDVASGVMKYSGDLTLKDYGDTDYYDLEIESGTASVVLSSDIKVANELKINDGKSLDIKSYTLTFEYYSGTNETVKIGGGKISSPATTVPVNKLEVTTSAELDINLTVTDLTCNSNSALTVSAGKTVSLPAATAGALTANGTLNLGGNSTFSSVTIGGSGSLNKTTSGGTISVGGNWTDGNASGGFTPNDCTVSFTDSATISGKSTFLKLEATGLVGKTLSFDSNCEITVTDSFYLSGTSAASLTVAGSGKIIVPEDYDKESGNYLNFTGSAPVLVGATSGSSDSIFAVAKNSVAAASFPAGWIDGDNTFVWLGGTDSTWTDTTNWAGGNAAGSGGSGKTILIRKGNKPQLSTDVTAKNITVSGSIGFDLSTHSVTAENFVTGSGTISIGDGTAGTNGNLTVTNITESTGSKIILNNGTFEYNGATDKTLTSDVELQGTVALESTGGKLTSSNVTYTSNPDLTTSGNITLNGGAVGNLTVSSGSTFTYTTDDLLVNGNLVNSGIINCSTTGKKLRFVNASDQSVALGSNNFVYLDLSFEGSGIKTIPQELMAASINIDSGVTVSINEYITLTDVTTNSGSLNIGTNGTFGDEVTNSGTITGGSGHMSFSKSVTNTGIINASSDYVTFTGDYIGTSGTLNGNANDGVNPTITFGGSTVTFGTFNHNSDKVIFSAANACLTSNGQKFYDVQLNGNLTVTDNFEFVHSLDGYTDGDQSLSVNGDTVFGGAAGGTTKLKSVSVTGTSALKGGSVKTKEGQTYTGAVTLGAATELTAGTDSTIKVTFGSTVNGTNDDTETLKVNGNAVFTGAVGVSVKLNSVEVTGASEIDGEAISTSSTQVYNGAVTLGNDTTLNASSVTLKSDVTGTGKALTVNAATVLDNSSGVEINTATVNFGGNISGSDLTVTGNAVIPTGKSVEVSNNISFGGNFSNSGIFKATAETITFTGSPAISGSSEFYNLSFLTAGKTVTFQAGSTQTITGVLRVNGEDGNTIKLISSAPGTEWEIAFNEDSVGKVVSYAEITDSKFTGSNGPAAAMNSKDNGNNTDWIFPGHEYTWTGNVSEAWDNKGNWSPNTIPGEGAVITIPASLSRYPVLTADLNLYYSTTYYGKIITVYDASDASTPGELKLEDHALTSGELINNGRLRLKGNESFQNIGTVTSGENSIVEYYGTSAKTSLWLAKSSGYKNLIVDSGAVLLTDDVTTAVNVTNNGTVNVTSDNLTVSNLLTSNGIIYVSKTLSFEKYAGSSDTVTVSAGTVTHTGSENAVIGNLETTGAATLNGTTETGKSLSVTAATYNSANLTTSGNVKLCTGTAGNVNVSSGSLTFTADFTLNNLDVASAASFTAGANTVTVKEKWTDDSESGFACSTGKIIFTGSDISIKEKSAFNIVETSSGKITLNESLLVENTFTATNADLTVKASSDNYDAAFSAPVTSNNITFEVPVNINGGSVNSPDKNQIYKKAVVLGNDTTLTGGTVTFENTVDGNHALIVDGKTVLGGGAVTTIIFTVPKVTFGSTVDGITADTETLKVNGNAVFTEAVGGTVRLNSVEVTEASEINGKTVKTSENQTYAGAVTLGDDTILTAAKVTFGGAVSGSHDLTVDAEAEINGKAVTTEDKKQVYEKGVVLGDDTTLTAGQVTFEGAVSGPHKLTVAAAAVINGRSVETENNDQLYNEAVTLGENTVFTASTVTFVKTVDGVADGAQNLTVSGAAVFGGEAGSVHKLNNLEVTGTSAINGGKVTVLTNQTYAGAVTLGDDTTLAAAKVTFGGAVSGPHELTVSANAVINGKSVTTENQNQVYEKIVVLGDDTTLTAGQVTFEGAVSGPHKLTVAAVAVIDGRSVETENNDQIYNEAVTLGENTVFTGSSVTFVKTVDGAADGAQDLKVEGKAVFGGEAGNVHKLNNIEVNGASAIDGGKVTTAGNQDYNGAVTLGADAAFFGTTVTFGSTITGTDQVITFNSDKAVLKGNVSVKDIISNAELESRNAADVTVQTSGIIQVNKTFDLDKVILVSGGKTSFNESGIAGTLTVTNEGVLELAPDKTLTVSGSFVQDGNGKNDIKGSLVTSGSGEVSFAQDVYMNGAPSPALVLGGGTGKFRLSKNLIVALESVSKELDVQSPLTADNIVLYSGKLSLNEDVSSERDIVLLGSRYGDNPEYAGEYLYTKNRKVTYNYSGFDSGSLENLPDGTALPSYDGELSVKAGTSLRAGKNFYANGLTMNGSGQWFLDAGKNADPHECFVEAYNCDISNSTVRNFGEEKPENTTGLAEACTFDGGNLWNETDETNFGSNRNWDFADFRILEVHTVSDSVLFVKLSSPVRNINREFDLNIGKVFFKNNGNPEGFAKAYKSFSITDQYGTVSSEDLGSLELSEFYIQTEDDSDSRWNTDASGLSSGNTESTDSFGKHQNAVPSLTFKRNGLSSPAWNFTNRFGKILKNSGTEYKDATDQAHPVLVEVSTGQEIHKEYDASVGEESQPSYDAHNFIEFRWSEAVDLDNGSSVALNAYAAGDAVNIFENQKVEENFGAVSEKSQGLLVAGLAEIEKGKLKTGKNGTADNTVHALYRKSGMSSHAVRLSVAGYTEGTVKDNEGHTYKKWTGYIDSSETPEGKVSIPGGSSDFVKDLSGNVMNLIKSDGLEIKRRSEYSVLSDYSLWDTSRPVFAAYRSSGREWKAPSASDNYESIGSTVDGTSSLKRLEFHMFDNAPEYNETEPQWVSKRGWVHPYSGDATPVLYTSDSYAADIFGGARPFEGGTARTRGGIRYSSISDSSAAFKYVIGKDKVPDLSFDDSVKAYAGGSSPVFQPVSNPSRNTGGADGLYFGYKLPETVLSLKTQFTVSYDDTKGYITDLAGNRLNSAVIQTMDLTPPSINMTVAPVGQNKIYVMFSKNLETGKVSLNDEDGNLVEKDALTEAYPNAFGLYTISESGILSESTGNNIDSSVPAKVLYQTGDYMGLELTLKNPVTYSDVKSLYLVANKESESYRDPVIDLSTNFATFVQDDTGIRNYLSAYSAHALSDFAVNLVEPLYAYNEEFAEGETKIQNGLYGEDSFAVHDWNAEQKNFGTLLVNDEIHIMARVNDEETVESNDFNARIYLDNSPDKASVSTEYNRTSKSNLRVWLPEITGFKMFSAISDSGNRDYEISDSVFSNGTDLSKDLDFKITKEQVSSWSEGSQVSFLFGLTDSSNSPVKIVHAPDYDYSSGIYSLSEKYPLFALRLKTPGDLLSLDLWSFRLKGITAQRGGVTILNNVIDAVKGEKTVLRIDNPSKGKVDVIVMTLDGNVVDYLNRGNLEAGTTNFTWNGKNRKGNAVARGIYFIRVIGNGFDETRKVMVVK